MHQVSTLRYFSLLRTTGQVLVTMEVYITRPRSVIPTLQSTPAVTDVLQEIHFEEEKHNEIYNGIPKNLPLPSEVSMVGRDQMYNDPGSKSAPSASNANGLLYKDSYFYVTRMQQDLADTIRKLQKTEKLLQSAREGNNKSENTAKIFMEVLRIMQNNEEIYKLENSQLNRLLEDEKLKSRVFRSQLFETKKVLEEAESRLNGSDLLQPNKTKEWDVHETVYNGEGWLRNWDNREPPMGQNHTVTATRNIFFLRHGHYEYSEPEETIEMSPLGAQQMEALGRSLAGKKYNWTRTFIHSSKHRTQQAAEIVATFLPGLQLEPSDLIWSCAYDVDSERRQRAFKHFIHRASPEQKKDSYELFMTHSSVIRYFVDRALQLPFQAIAMPLIHGSITRIEIAPDGRVMLKQYGDYSHMSGSLLTASNSKWMPSQLTAAEFSTQKPAGSNLHDL